MRRVDGKGKEDSAVRNGDYQPSASWGLGLYGPEVLPEAKRVSRETEDGWAPCMVPAEGCLMLPTVSKLGLSPVPQPARWVPNNQSPFWLGCIKRWG